MRIEGPSAIKSAPRSAKAAAATGFSALVEAAAPRAAAITAPAALVAGLVDTDAGTDAAGGRSRGLAQGDSMLQDLEELRRALLLGTVPAVRLTQLSNKLAEREHTEDPVLSGILGDIELRVAVELAKLGLAPACLHANARL